MKTPIPDVTAKVYLVGHGYQIDVEVKDGSSFLKWSSCHDFGDDYQIKRLKLEVANAMLEMMKELERNKLRKKPKLQAIAPAWFSS